MGPRATKDVRGVGKDHGRAAGLLLVGRLGDCSFFQKPNT